MFTLRVKLRGVKGGGYPCEMAKPPCRTHVASSHDTFSFPTESPNDTDNIFMQPPLRPLLRCSRRSLFIFSRVSPPGTSSPHPPVCCLTPPFLLLLLPMLVYGRNLANTQHSRSSFTSSCGFATFSFPPTRRHVLIPSQTCLFWRCRFRVSPSIGKYYSSRDKNSDFELVSSEVQVA